MVVPASVLVLCCAAVLAAEPTVGACGWSNVPGAVEGVIATRPIDTTVPRPPLGYLEYLPKGYDPADPARVWPLLLFISGLGESGDGTDTDANHHQLLVNMSRHGPFRQVLGAGWDFPAVVIAAQHDGLWNNAGVLQSFFDYLRANYRVDPDRFYLTGLCDGAVGVMNFAAQHPGLLAGILPIECGSPPGSGMAAAIAGVPMWAVHAFSDPIIARTSTIAWIDQATRAELGASDVMASYPGYDGKSWHAAADPDPASGAPLLPFGPTTDIAGCIFTAGSPWVAFPSTTTFGSAIFNSWGGSDARPYALVVPGPAPPPGARAGLMLRDSIAPGSVHVFIAQGVDNQVAMQWRSASGGASGGSAKVGGSAPAKWLRLVRSGQVVTGSYSLDGSAWTTIASATVAFSGPGCLAGLAATARDGSRTYAQTCAGLAIAGTPPGALTDADIGAPARAGSASGSGGAWTITAGGLDIGGTADQGNFAYTGLAGDQEIVARVGSATAPGVIALGKPNGAYLTRPWSGASGPRNISIQLPLGYNATAWLGPGSGWSWVRGQAWERTRAQKRIFTMCWYQDHSRGWADTYANGDCWDWLFSQSRPAPPAITVQPRALAVPVGWPAQFTVAARGSGPLAYQWRRGGVAIAGATAASYALSAVAAGDDGAVFSVTVSNALGSVTSSGASLAVAAPAAGEPALAIAGWSNLPGTVEGTIRVRPIDTTAPRPPYGYLDYLPAGYDPAGTTRWPLIIHLTDVGAAGDGTDTAANGHQLQTRLLQDGPLHQVATAGWDFPAVVIAPQVGSNWAKPANVKAVVDYALANYRIDPDRVLLTGHREGADGALRFAVAYPGVAAAILAIEAGIPTSSAQAAALRTTPSWLVHSFSDPQRARGIAIAWTDAVAAADSGGTSDAMATYPGYGGDRNHYAVDVDPASGLPLAADGIAYALAATLTAGSSGVGITAMPVGSAIFGMWGGSEARPFASMQAAGDGTRRVLAGAHAADLVLVRTWNGVSGAAAVTVRTAWGYDLTAQRDGDGTWGWRRGQEWDPGRPDRRLLTLFWAPARADGGAADPWTATWANVDAWDWLLERSRLPAGSG